MTECRRTASAILSNDGVQAHGERFGQARREPNYVRMHEGNQTILYTYTQTQTAYPPIEGTGDPAAMPKST